MAKEINDHGLSSAPTAVAPVNAAKAAFWERTLRFMEAEGARFHIELPDGSSFGEPIKAKTTRGPRTDWNSRYGHIAVLKALQPNGMHRFTVPAEERAQFQSALTGMSCHMYGSGNYTTSQWDGQHDGGVDIYRHP